VTRNATPPEFKRVLAQARDEDLVEFTSVAGLPARAVNTPWLQHYLQALPRLEEDRAQEAALHLAFDCLAQCGLRDGLAGWGQFCIDTQLAAGLARRPEEGPVLPRRRRAALRRADRQRARADRAAADAGHIARGRPALA
jgi:nitronate monooxygenase